MTTAETTTVETTATAIKTDVTYILPANVIFPKRISASAVDIHGMHKLIYNEQELKQIFYIFADPTWADPKLGSWVYNADVTDHQPFSLFGDHDDDPRFQMYRTNNKVPYRWSLPIDKMYDNCKVFVNTMIAMDYENLREHDPASFDGKMETEIINYKHPNCRHDKHNYDRLKKELISSKTYRNCKNQRLWMKRCVMYTRKNEFFCWVCFCRHANRALCEFNQAYLENRSIPYESFKEAVLFLYFCRWELTSRCTLGALVDLMEVKVYKYTKKLHD
jgi:hypothetical protein